jgi:hypothetical protein
MKRVKKWATVTLAFLPLAFLTGCGSGLNEVEGKVTLDGRTVPGLEIRFEPKDPSVGTTAMGYTQADGTYKLHYPGDKTGAPAGDYTVTITGGDKQGEGGSPVRVASQFNSKSQLTATVKSGKNTFNFDVTSAKGGEAAPAEGMGD